SSCEEPPTIQMRPPASTSMTAVAPVVPGTAMLDQLPPTPQFVSQRANQVLPLRGYALRGRARASTAIAARLDRPVSTIATDQSSAASQPPLHVAYRSSCWLPVSTRTATCGCSDASKVAWWSTMLPPTATV